MEKQIINKEILYKTKNGIGVSEPFSWKEIKEALKNSNIELQDDDILTIGFSEEDSCGDSCMPAHYYFTINREVLETDEEFEKRKQQMEELKKENSKRRYKLYLELKEEFE
jgi:hypothetical protein